MAGELRSLGRETLVYGLSTVLGRLLNFLLIPLYTHWLAPAEYGIVATVFAGIAFLNVVYSHGLDFAYLRFAAAADDPRREFSTAFWSLAGAALPLSLCLHAFAGPLASAAGLADWPEIIRYSAWILALDALALVPFGELRLRHRAFAFAGIKTAGIAINIALNFVFVREMGMGVRGVFLASLAASSATLTMLTPVLAARLRGVFDRALASELARFGLPLVPAGLASMIVQVLDRPLLKALADDASVGLYQANSRLAIVMMMFVNMFDAAWRPFFLQKASHPQAPVLFARVATYFCLMGGFVVLGVTLFIADVAALPVFGKPIIHPAYWAGLGIVPLALWGHLLHGLYVNFLAPVTLGKRTDLIAYAAGAGALVNIAANLALIPSLGYAGAAWAGLAAHAAMAAAMWAWGRRLYPVPYEWRRLAAAGALTAGLAWLGRDAGPAARGLLLAAYPVALALAGFFTDEEMGELRKALGR